MKKKLLIIPLILLVALAYVYSNYLSKPYFLQNQFNPLPLAEVLKPDQVPDYQIVMIGDSMTESLGNNDELRAYLKKYYPDKTFLVLNYGYGATNILSVPERLEKETIHGRKFQPILDIPFDIIILESFGHNPLSDYPLEEGLEKQNETLDYIVKKIRDTHPNAKLILMATIAPNSKKYGGDGLDLTPEKRAAWANERKQYIKNHIKYAKDHQIPLINVYQKSLNKDGDGDLNYIETKSYIHPSPLGLYLIGEEVAKVVKEELY